MDVRDVSARPQVYSLSAWSISAIPNRAGVAKAHSRNLLRGQETAPWHPYTASPRWWIKQDPIHDPLPTNIEQQQAWRFYSDSDHAGNTEVSNRYKSHWGGLATLGGAPVLFVARSTGVAMAHPKISPEEGHADTSSAAVEVYAAGNMTHEMLHLSYVAEDMGIKFPAPAILQVDNDACKLAVYPR